MGHRCALFFDVDGTIMGKQGFVPESAVEDLKVFIRQRGAWMDEYIDVVQQYGHPSVNKRYNH